MGDKGRRCQVAWPQGTNRLLRSFRPETGPNAGTWAPTFRRSEVRWRHDGTLGGPAARVQGFINELTDSAKEREDAGD